MQSKRKWNDDFSGYCYKCGKYCNLCSSTHICCICGDSPILDDMNSEKGVTCIYCQNRK